MSAPKSPKLTEIAARIAAHLARIENKEAGSGSKSPKYWHANSWRTGSRVSVTYISYQNTTNLTKSDALEYLAWLDAGNEGKHYEILGFNARIRETTP